MTNTPRREKAETRRVVPSRVRWAKYCYLGVAGLFTVGVLVQVYIAGLAVFVDAARWGAHVSFGNILPVFLLLLLAIALIGRLPRILKGLPVVIFLLFLVQFGTAHRFGSFVGAIHPVNAFVIFWLSTITVYYAWMEATAEEGPSETE